MVYDIHHITNMMFGTYLGFNVTVRYDFVTAGGKTFFKLFFNI